MFLTIYGVEKSQCDRSISQSSENLCTGKSNYGLNLSVILMFLTIYGVEKSQCDRSKVEFLEFDIELK